VFTIVVLMRPSVKEAFGQGQGHVGQRGNSDYPDRPDSPNPSADDFRFRER